MSEELKLWENAAINDAVKHAIQIRENIEHIAITSNAEITSMPASIVPTGLLYNLACCYEILYNLALMQQLIETGNLRSTTNNIH
jgi:hypothetical protein